MDRIDGDRPTNRPPLILGLGQVSRLWVCARQGQRAAGTGRGAIPRLAAAGHFYQPERKTPHGATWEADNVHPGAYILAALDWADQRKHRREISERHRHRAAHAHCEKDTELGEEDHGCKQR